MSVSRIQKLLFSEYCDFEDMVLVESPFAQTTREGKGVRQVHLGLTPTKLILATDKLLPANETYCTYIPGVDPDVETFELIAVYPLECVRLSVFHRRKHKSIKAHFCTNRVLYFELGGFQKRKMFWNLWCEKIKYMNTQNDGSSHSETSVATSTTNSTLYLLSSKRVVTDSGVQQMWCRFGGGDTSLQQLQKWHDRYLFMGKSFEDLPHNYTPSMVPPTTSQFLIPHSRTFRGKLSLPGQSRNVPQPIPSNIRIGDVYQINRFASGVRENCGTGLYLPAENYIIPRRFSNTTYSTGTRYSVTSYLDYCEVAESCVRLWEKYKEIDPNAYSRKHKRRYGLAPQPHFLYGLGPWNVPPGGRVSLQIKRAVSEVSIRRQPLEPELRLPISKRQLVATISCEALNFSSDCIKNSPKKPVLLFWTPDYWYRPRTAKDAYQELRSHLTRIDKRHKEIHKNASSHKKRLFRRKKKMAKNISSSSSDEIVHKKLKRSSTRILGIFASKQAVDQGCTKEPRETSLQYLRRMLRMDIALTAWDFDSTTLAQQLTMIEKELFLKIPSSELNVLLWQQSSKNAPNVGAVLAFSHRISCLIVTEVLRDDSEKIRARLVARFINVADKCDRMANFQSCKSVLSGLQSPAIYRLHKTWSYVRKRHATKYQTFEELCRLYRDPRRPAYQKAFLDATRNSAYIPYIGDIIARLLDKLPDYRANKLFTGMTKENYVKTPAAAQLVQRASNADTQSAQKTNVLRKLLSTLRIWPATDVSSAMSQKAIKSKKTKQYAGQKGIMRNLHELYRPLHKYDDNRLLRLNEAIELLETFQRATMNYVLNVNELAREYLLKARYREDKENFYNSLNLEPCYVRSDLWQYSKNC